MEPFAWRPSCNALILPVRVRPNARKTALSSLSLDSISININGMPQDGEANIKLVHFLSQLFHIPKSSITIIAGSKSKDKLISFPSTPSSYRQVALDFLSCIKETLLK